jgi:hypothetical protein
VYLVLVAIAAATTTAATTAAATAAAVAAAVTAAAAAEAAATAAAATEAAATTAAAATATGTTLLGLVDPERTTVEQLAVHGLDGLLGRVLGAHGHEREAAGPAGLAIEHQLDLDELTELLEGLADGVLGRVEREITYIETIVHLLTSVPAFAAAPQNGAPLESCRLKSRFFERRRERDQ